MPAPKKVQNQSPEDIVKPSIHIEGDKEHALRVLFKEESAPIIKSVGCIRIPGLNVQGGSYVSFVMTSKGSEILSIVVEQPNLRAIAEESAKMAFVDTCLSGEE